MTGDRIAKKGFLNRAVLPAAAVTACWGAVYLAYICSPAIGSPGLHRWVSLAAGLATLIMLIMGTPVAYSLAYFRGALPVERAAASLAVPVVWIISELVRVRAYFTLGETLYYALNPLFVQMIFLSIMLSGICEILCRFLERRRGADGPRLITPGPLAAILAGVLSFLLIFGWEFGVHAFYIYMKGYRALFL